jgi:hypothetical protein
LYENLDYYCPSKRGQHKPETEALGYNMIKNILQKYTHTISDKQKSPTLLKQIVQPRKW